MGSIEFCSHSALFIDRRKGKLNLREVLFVETVLGRSRDIFQRTLKIVARAEMARPPGVHSLRVEDQTDECNVISASATHTNASL